MLSGLRRYLETWNTLSSSETTKCAQAGPDGETQQHHHRLIFKKKAPEGVLSCLFVTVLFAIYCLFRYTFYSYYWGPVEMKCKRRVKQITDLHIIICLYAVIFEECQQLLVTELQQSMCHLKRSVNMTMIIFFFECLFLYLCTSQVCKPSTCWRNLKNQQLCNHTLVHLQEKYSQK